MNKKLWMATILLAAMLVLTGCAFGVPAATDGQKECDTYTVAQLRSDQALAQKCATEFGFSYVPPQGGASGPAATTAPAPAEPMDFGACQAPDFSSFVGNPYELIAKLDAQSAKVAQPSIPFTIDATNGCILYWTGAYNGGKLPTGFIRLLVDGQTGVYLVQKGVVVTVNSVGAWMPLSAFDPNAKPRQDSGMATGCMPAKEVIDLLNDHRISDPERVFRELDMFNNVEGAPYISSRMRPSPDGPASYKVQNTKAIWWVATGKINGPVIELLQSQGKSLYLVTEDADVQLTYSHTGAVLCEDLNPSRDITDWD